MSEFMPNMSDAVVRAKSNKALWEGYVETDEDKKVYTKKISTLNQSDNSLESLQE